MRSKVLLQRVVPLLAVLVLIFGGTSPTRAQRTSTSVGLFEMHSDIGKTPKKGSAAYDPATGEYRVTGGGTHMWGATEAVHFFLEKMYGDIGFSAEDYLARDGTPDD